MARLAALFRLAFCLALAGWLGLGGIAQAGQQRAPGAIARMVTIAIDAGHGGEDPGAIGRRGTQEKDVVLRIAQLLRAGLAGGDQIGTWLAQRCIGREGVTGEHQCEEQ